MNVEKFRIARENFLNHRPFTDPKEYKNALDAIKEAASPEHVFENIGVTVFDRGKCSCGWMGSNFWDGADLAFAEWREHVANAMGLAAS